MEYLSKLTVSQVLSSDVEINVQKYATNYYMIIWVEERNT